MSIRQMLVLAALLSMGLVGPLAAQSHWGPELKLHSFGFGTTGPGILVKGATVHYTWWDEEIWYKRSTDRGTTWGLDTRLTFASGKSEMPGLALAGSTLVVMWMDDRRGMSDLYYRRSEDGGLTWGPEARLTSGAGVFRFWLAASGSTIHAVYHHRLAPGTFYGDLSYVRSTDGGRTWGRPVQFTNGGAARPVVDTFSDYVHVTWGDDGNGNPGGQPEVRYKRSTDGGATWGPDIRITNNPWWSGRSRLTVSDTGVVYIVWDDGYGSGVGDPLEELYFTRSTNHGRTWEPARPITSAPNIQTHANMAVSGSAVHLVWTDKRDGDWKPYYKSSSDGGATWGPDELLHNVKDTWAGLVAVAGREVLVTYADATTMYYRKRRVAP